MMKNVIIHACRQQSEEWESLRLGRATSSNFDRIVTPAKLQLSSSAELYAIELAVQRCGIRSVEPLPSYWMDHGTECEPYAVDEFQQVTGLQVQQVGFITPASGEMYGCSTDGLVGDNAVIEVKCPKPETLVAYRTAGSIPQKYVMQVQGELWVTGRQWCHFWVWHPELEPVHYVVERDERIHAALDEHVPAFLQMIDRYQLQVKARPATAVICNRDEAIFDE